MEQEITRKIRVYGIVQGVGFRPTVSRHAVRNGIRGTVCNKGPYVEIYAQGRPDQVEGFLRDLKEHPPKRAAILKLDEWEERQAPAYEEFSIIESEKVRGEIFVSPDIGICDECKTELYDPKNRRYLHPFINCTCCGPRMTILDGLPYDRIRTSMKEFPMCPSCEREYHHPGSRRFDAQPVCCNDCGPEVYLLEDQVRRGRAAITRTRQIIRDGGIAAIKGIGGFHLCCDATNAAAVRRLRERKNRPVKPFAVMARNLDCVRKACHTDGAQEELLTGYQKPILLLERKEEADICPETAPGNPTIGMMLPYAPLQLLLFDYDDGITMPDYLVMTSGNLRGAPICRDDAEARAQLASFCDCILSHNRRIRIRADDSVMDFYEGEPYMIRRSRGYAPLPVQCDAPWKGQVLAVGGELKNTFCIGVDARFYPSPYIGDLEDLRTVAALEETIGRMETLLEVQPKVVACDLHPGYNSTRLAGEMGLPVLTVQHHYAHVLSCMAENHCAKPVIGVAFDGTGYGEDGSIWGGEFLLSDYDGYERLGSIEPFLQVGADAAVREGWRIAVALLYAQTPDREACLRIADRLHLCDQKACRVQMSMADGKINAVVSTSAGRLFDAVSAVLGICLSSTFEGEASMALEFAAEAYEKEQPQAAARERALWENSDLCKPRQQDGRFLMRTGELFAWLVRARLNGEETGKLAYDFHAALAAQIRTLCLHIAGTRHCSRVALSGGVYQNRLLLGLTGRLLEREGIEVLRHHLVPPNDGGIGLGQAVYAMQKLNASVKESEYVCRSIR